MRIFALLFSLLIALPIFGQYRTISTKSEVHFDFLAGMHSRVILTDSFQVFDNDTIIYHEFNQEFEIESAFIGDTLPGCYNLSDTGFLSYQTILQEDGTDIYFNHLHDSIFIQTQANLNDTWIFYQNPNGSYFEATVTMLDTNSFLGIVDSTKTITLQAKDSLGNTISSPYDALVLKISKRYGLIEGFNLFGFPRGTSNFFWGSNLYEYNPIRILGFSKHNIGVDNLIAAKVYDYDIGDEYHWKTERTAGFGHNSPSFSETYDIITINNKSFSTNGDTVYL